MRTTVEVTDKMRGFISNIALEKDWTNIEMSENLGLSYNCISKIIQGSTKRVRIDTLNTMAHSLGMTYSDLVKSVREFITPFTARAVKNPAFEATDMAPIMVPVNVAKCPDVVELLCAFHRLVESRATKMAAQLPN